MSLQNTTETIFRATFGYKVILTVKAPGLVNLIDEHTDYNDGFVLHCAIDYETVISRTRRYDRKIRVITVNYDCQHDIFLWMSQFYSMPISNGPIMFAWW